MPGPPPKSAGRQRRNKSGLAESRPAVAEVVSIDRAPSATQVPAPDPEWSAEIVDQWQEAWCSDLGSYWLDTDEAMVRRCFDLRHRIAVAESAAYQDGSVTVGSAGQLALHPLLKHADTLRDDLLSLEDRLGLSPMARLRLGVKLGEAAESLAKLNARIGEQTGNEPESPFVAMTVAQLRKELSSRDLPTRGRKKELVERLEEAIAPTESPTAGDPRAFMAR